jgi:uncharacterized protein
MMNDSEYLTEQQPEAQGDFTKQFRLEDERLFNNILGDFLTDDTAALMKGFIQHGTISTYEHAENVARVSYIINKKLRLHANIGVLLRGAFLHDFYLYDWHKKELHHRLHGFRHPRTAALNAAACYGVGLRERQVIESHMWPLTISKIPRSREAWIVCLADKLCASIETVKMRTKKR